MNIQFDETNLLADVVGPANGVTRAEVSDGRKRALHALAAFRKLSESGAPSAWRSPAAALLALGPASLW